MAASLFIAVQCFQCSTMQVKQQIKSRNKWVCAVCNERQSVRRIYARSHLAKDVRLFVQSFNISLTDRPLGGRDPVTVPTPNRSGGPDFGSEMEAIGAISGAGDGRRKRTDWTEYLDPDPDEDEDKDGDNQGSEFESRVVTESPEKKSKNVFPRCLRGGRAQGTKMEPLKPIFPKRRLNQVQCDAGPKKNPRMEEKSKWSKYSEEDKENRDSSGMERNLVAEAAEKIQFGDGVPVEEEVHPDFT